MSNGKKKEPSIEGDGDQPLIQARHENSVLFTLNDLGAAANRASAPPRTRPASIDDDEDASGYINLAHKSAVGAAGGGTPAGHASDDASGFIDIGALSSLPPRGGAAGPTESGDLSTPAAPAGGPAPLVGNVVTMGTRQDNTGIKIALGVAVGALLLALGVLIVVLVLKGDDKPTVVTKTAPPEAGTAGAGIPPGTDKKAPEEPKKAAVEDDKEDDKKDDEGAVADKGDDDEKDSDEKDDGEDEKGGEADDKKDADAAKKADDKKDRKADAKKAADKVAAKADDKKDDKKDPKEDVKPTDAVEKADDGGSKAPDKADDKAPEKGGDRMDDILKGLDKKKDDDKASDLPATLSRGAVKSVVGRHRGRVAGCGGPGKKGTVIVRFTILPNGNVGGASVAGDKKGTPEAGCVAGVVRSMKFPPFAGSSMTINYPFILP